MGIGPTTYNLATLPLPDWAKGKSFNEYLEVDANLDGTPDYLVNIKRNKCTNTLSKANVEIRDMKTGQIADPDKVYVQFNGGAHDVSAYVWFDIDGKGVREADPVAYHRLAAEFNTARRYVSFAPSETAPEGINPVCVACVPGLDVQAQGVFQKLSPSEKAYGEIDILMQRLFKENGYQPLEEIALDMHGFDNRLEFEATDGKTHRLIASEVLSIIAPYMAKNGKIVFLACDVAKGDAFEQAATQMTSPDGDYKDLKIFASETGVGSPKDPKLHENHMSTYSVDSTGKRTATSGLLCITAGQVRKLNAEAIVAQPSGTVGRYTSKTIFGQ